ncbi:MAG: hypothetical protein M1356_08305, partial [Gammaproteobacteria bacterium]|nr:hypothetical protein [Gammaproteobacteria bacterium]
MPRCEAASAAHARLGQKAWFRASKPLPRRTAADVRDAVNPYMDTSQKTSDFLHKFTLWFFNVARCEQDKTAFVY